MAVEEKEILLAGRKCGCRVTIFIQDDLLVIKKSWMNILTGLPSYLLFPVFALLTLASWILLPWSIHAYLTNDLHFSTTMPEWVSLLTFFFLLFTLIAGLSWILLSLLEDVAPYRRWFDFERKCFHSTTRLPCIPITHCFECDDLELIIEPIGNDAGGWGYRLVFYSGRQKVNVFQTEQCGNCLNARKEGYHLGLVIKEFFPDINEVRFAESQWKERAQVKKQANLA